MRILALFLTLSTQTIASQWNNQFTDFRTEQYVLLPVLAGATLLTLAQSPPKKVRWKSGIFVDEDFRRWLRAESKQGRKRAQKISDAIWYSLIGFPLVGDSLVDLRLSKSDSKASGQTALIGLQSFLVTGLITTLTKNLVGRERPYQKECNDNPTSDPMCHSADSRRSFISGHASLSFTGAGLICAYREHINLFGDRALCLASLGLASIATLARSVADRHYLSDLIAGIGVGLFSGYLLPKLLHFNGSTVNKSSQPQAAMLRFRLAW